MSNKIKQAYESIEYPAGRSRSTLETLLAENRREGITMKKNRSPKRIAAIAAASAAALAMTVTAGAVAYNALFHRESAERFGVAEAAYSGEGFEAKAVENEHFRFTVDSVLSDGIMAHAVFTVEPLDDLGRQYTEMAVAENGGACPVIWVSDDDKEVLYDRSFFHANIGGELALDLNSDGSFSFESDFYIGDLESTELWIYPEDRYADTKLIYNGAERVEHSAPSMFDGLEMQLDLGRNVEVREFTNGEDTLYLSQTAVTIVGPGAAEREKMELERENNNFTDPEPEYYLVYEDGGRSELIVGGTSWSPRPDKGYETMFLHQTIDLKGVSKVVYYDREYTPA